MWKDRRRPEMSKTDSETTIDKRDRSIRNLIDELVAGTVELKSLYEGDTSDRPKPA